MTHWEGLLSVVVTSLETFKKGIYFGLSSELCARPAGIECGDEFYSLPWFFQYQQFFESVEDNTIG